MIVWIASYQRSGNTFFRVVMHHLYGVNTYPVFNAGEELVTAGAGELVGHKKRPAALQAAITSGKPELIRSALDQLEASEELFVFKTHAAANELFGTNYRAVLVVRDGRDAIASFANFRVDVRFEVEGLNFVLHRMRQSKAELLNPHWWSYIAKMLIVTGAKKAGLRRWMVARRIDQLIRGNRKHDLYLDWTKMNRSWLERDRKPVVVYFNDLIRDPIATVTGAVDKLEIGLVPSQDGSLPSFPELKNRYPNFFRKGTSGDWRNYFSPQQEKLFKSRHQEMMKRLSFPF
jgi:hypothetical protein